MPRFCKALIALLATTLGTSVATAQWTNNPASPLVVGDASSDGPIVLPTPDGGCYIGWQGSVGGVPYNSIHLQRLDAAGHELWGHNGIIAAIGNSSSTQVGEFDLAIASDGNALVSTSIRMPDTANPTVHQATVQKFAAADGHRMWGTGGGDVSVTTGASQISWAHVCSTPDGGCTVGYTFSSGTTVLIRFMRFSAAGVPVWNFPGTQVFISGSFLDLVGMQPGGADGSFIAVWGSGGTMLQTQKFTGGSGTTPGTVFPGWGTASTPITIDSGGLTGFNFYQIIMLSDGNGGAIYGWSTFTSGFAGCSTALLQHILSNGTVKFTPAASNVNHFNVPCGGGGKGQYSGRPAFRQDPGSNPPTYIYYLASEQGPSASGSVTSALVQKFDNSGNRLWSDSGVVVVPDYNSAPNWIRPVATSDGGCICVGDLNVGQAYGSNAVYAAKIIDDPSSSGYGTAAWTTIINTNLSTAKGRMGAVSVTGTDDVIVVHTSGGVLDAIRVAAANGAPGVVPLPPSLDMDVPASITACDGDTITLSVQVSGAPPLVYSWQRHYAFNVSGNPNAAWGLSDGDSSFGCQIPSDGTTYSGTSTATLTIHNIHANNPTASCPNSDPSLNQYRCVVYGAGSPSGSATISSWAQITVGTGACCAPDGTCTSVCLAANCPSGLYQGFGSTCFPNPCGGACCSASACTTAASQDTCNGSFHGLGTSCAPTPCPGSCCDNTTGECSAVPASYACASSGTFSVFGVCSPNPCPQPGACCNTANGVCAISVLPQCNSGHTFQGVGTLCDPTPCPSIGACCSNVDGSYCVILSQASCIAINSRRWQGQGSVCNPLPCPQPGACCEPSTGNCTVVAQPGCASPNTFQSGGTCDVNPCPQPLCCDATTGTCSVVPAGQCTGQAVASASCTPNPCPAPIPCCNATFCAMSLPNFCSSPATGSTCNPNPCAPATGVCCRGSTCITTFTSSSACSASLVSGQQAGAFFLSGSACNAVANAKTPCCYADYNKIGGVTVADIFAYLSDWFAGGHFAIVGSSGTSGTPTVANIFGFLSAWFGGC